MNSLHRKLQEIFQFDDRTIGVLVAGLPVHVAMDGSRGRTVLRDGALVDEVLSSVQYQIIRENQYGLSYVVRDTYDSGEQDLSVGTIIDMPPFGPVSAGQHKFVDVDGLYNIKFR